MGLDALRGLTILAMVFYSVLPRGILPAWMYHSQVPPPDHVFNPALPGITWVDLVFPFFLFSMGAAMPFALQRRLEKGMPRWQAVLTILKRGALLLFFAVFREHISPEALSHHPTASVWAVALAGFVLLFAVLARFPDGWPLWLHGSLRLAGWCGAGILLACVRFPDGSGFSIARSDIILRLLAAAAVFGSLAWLFTRESLFLRVGLLGVLMALRLANASPGWVHEVVGTMQIPYMIDLMMSQYLFIVIPGTIAGDMILRWMRAPADPAGDMNAWQSGRYVAIAGLLATVVVVNVIGLQARWIGATVLLSALACGSAWKLTSIPTNATENLLRQLFQWGVYWLVLGLLFEPYEAGIKKDPATVSYFFVSAGLAVFTMIVLMIILDVFQKVGPLRILVENGQNPMIAYVGMDNLIVPVLGLVGLLGFVNRITPGPWLGCLRSALLTALLALVVSRFTRRKIFLRT